VLRRHEAGGWPTSCATSFKYGPILQAHWCAFTCGARPLNHSPNRCQIQILIVENHQIVAEGLASLLNQQPDMVVVGIAGSVVEAAAYAIAHRPDVVILDCRLDDGTGGDAAVGIRQARRDAKLIFLTRDDSDAARFMAVLAGASAFIHKSRAATELIEAVRTVAAGGTLIPPHTIATLLKRRREADGQSELLTAREKQVLSLMAQGLSSREIASRLAISYVTVRSHIRSMGGKLAVHSKLQAVAKARELALID
jgi:two-component system response regulator DevR